MRCLYLVSALLLPVILSFTSCSSLPALFSPTPTPQPIVVDCRFSGPVHLGEWVPIRVSVATRDAFQNMSLLIDTASPDVSIAEPRDCYVNTLPGKPAHCTFTVRFEKEGFFGPVCMAFPHGGWPTLKSLNVQITRTGATLEPEFSGPNQPIEKLPARTPTSAP
jgi:hypothetical protein